MFIANKTMVAIALSAMVAGAAFATTAEAGGKLVITKPIAVDVIVDPGPKIEDPFVQYPLEPEPKPKKPIYVPLPIFPKHAKTDDPELMIDCKVADAGDDMWLINFGSDEIPMGTKVRFSVPSTGDHGAFLLPRSIDPGKKIKVSDLLHGADDGAPCRVQILE